MNVHKPSVVRVYSSINAITAELAHSGIAKSQVSEEGGYRFRGIDDVVKALAPLLARHRLCILPRVLAREVHERHGANRSLLMSVSLRVAFDIVSARDGSVHTIEVHGEALDAGDKATAKAMSAAYKQAMLQSFCIPAGEDDSDAQSHRLETSEKQLADPVQGWEQWTLDICDLIAGCETDEAVGRVHSTYRHDLRLLSRRQPELFAAVGNAMTERRGAFGQAADIPTPASQALTKKRGNGSGKTSRTASADSAIAGDAINA